MTKNKINNEDKLINLINSKIDNSNLTYETIRNKINPVESPVSRKLIFNKYRIAFSCIISVLILLISGVVISNMSSNNKSDSSSDYPSNKDSTAANDESTEFKYRDNIVYGINGCVSLIIDYNPYSYESPSTGAQILDSYTNLDNNFNDIYEMDQIITYNINFSNVDILFLINYYNCEISTDLKLNLQNSTSKKYNIVLGISNNENILAYETDGIITRLNCDLTYSFKEILTKLFDFNGITLDTVCISIENRKVIYKVIFNNTYYSYELK